MPQSGEVVNQGPRGVVARAVAGLLVPMSKTRLALGGFYMLAKWVAAGGHRQGSTTKLPPAVIFGHFLLAATGLVLWIIYLAIGSLPVGWAGLIVLAPVAVLGLIMFLRWIPTYRDQGAQNVPERSFPALVVGGHGVLAVTTVVLALVTLIDQYR